MFLFCGIAIYDMYTPSNRILFPSSRNSFTALFLTEIRLRATATNKPNKIKLFNLKYKRIYADKHI